MFNTILYLAILRIVLTNVCAVEKFPIEQLHSNHSKNELEKKRLRFTSWKVEEYLEQNINN